MLQQADEDTSEADVKTRWRMNDAAAHTHTHARTAMHYAGHRAVRGMQSLTLAGETGLRLNKPGFHRRLLYLANRLLCSAAILEDEDEGRKKKKISSKQEELKH